MKIEKAVTVNDLKARSAVITQEARMLLDEINKRIKKREEDEKAKKEKEDKATDA